MLVVSGNEESKGDELRHLREALGNLALAASAEREHVDEGSLYGLSTLHTSPTSTVDDSASSYSFSVTNRSGYTSPSSDVSGQQPFSSALGFLKAIFPHTPSQRLRDALATHGGGSNPLDMEAVVEEILSQEYIHDLEERGLDEMESVALGYEAPWETVERKTKGSKQKKRSKKGTTLTLVDIRQQHHVRAASSSSQPAPPDPWTQLASLASHLSTLIPTHPPSFFQSIFHSPQYATPSQALRAAIVQIAQSLSKGDDELTAEETPCLYNMLEIITTLPKYAELNVEERDQLLEDALFALRATGGDPNCALDIISLLVDLDSDYSSKKFSRGVYHQAPTKTPPPKVTTKLPSGPPPTPPNISQRSQCLPSRYHEKPRASPNAWKTVPAKPGPKGPHPLSGVIRAYSDPTAPTRKVRGSGNGLGKGGKGDVGELQISKRAAAKKRAWELSEQRRAALREASRAWQKGNSKNHGGEVAFYFAERARELQHQQQKEQLEAAREMVMRTRKTCPDSEIIDLHGTVVAEAIAIVREYLAERAATNARPLKIITGRGSHSRNGVAVLGPAVKNALTADGWLVDTCDGGLIVRGSSR
ncbi:Smr-domain-containing protein [Trametes punicea]|nr:Smr-domain-containing protein [Trametes punicea]